VARLLPPESSSVEHVSREVGVGVATLERWRADALANGPGAGPQRWTPAARLQAVIATATMDDATRSGWCREQGLYPAELEAWKQDAIAGLVPLHSGIDRLHERFQAEGSHLRSGPPWVENGHLGRSIRCACDHH
jgi:transposase-like protein